MLKNTKNQYGNITKMLHWGMAFVLIGMFIVAYIMMNLEPGDFKWQLYGMHKATGMLALMLVAARFFWRMMNVTPDLPTTLPKWQKTGAHLNYFLLYFLMFAMPFSGMMMSLFGGHGVSFYGLFTIEPFEKIPAIGRNAHMAHEYISYVLIASFTLHVLAALYHHFFLRDNLLRRMLPGS